jgi:hypothetical protein
LFLARDVLSWIFGNATPRNSAHEDLLLSRCPIQFLDGDKYAGSDLSEYLEFGILKYGVAMYCSRRDDDYLPGSDLALAIAHQKLHSPREDAEEFLSQMEVGPQYLAGGFGDAPDEESRCALLGTNDRVTVQPAEINDLHSGTSSSQVLELTERNNTSFTGTFPYNKWLIHVAIVDTRIEPRSAIGVSGSGCGGKAFADRQATFVTLVAGAA